MRVSPGISPLCRQILHAISMPPTYICQCLTFVHTYLCGHLNRLCIDITPCPYGMYSRVEGTMHTGLFVIEVMSIKIQ